jgi:hypothetical protein
MIRTRGYTPENIALLHKYAIMKKGNCRVCAEAL